MSEAEVNRIRREDLFVVVEELPEFPGGGRDAMKAG